MSTDITKARTVAEIEAELKAARDAEAEQKRKRDEALRDAQRREEIVLTDGYMHNLRDALLKEGIESSVKSGKVDTYLRFAALQFPEDSESFKVHDSPFIERRSTASYQIKFGGYRGRKLYPRLKDGTFNYEKIASDFAVYVRQQTAQREVLDKRSAVRKESQKLVEKLEGKFPRTLGVSLTASESNPEHVVVNIKDSFSLDHAAMILALISSIREDKP